MNPPVEIRFDVTGHTIADLEDAAEAALAALMGDNPRRFTYSLEVRASAGSWSPPTIVLWTATVTAEVA